MLSVLAMSKKKERERGNGQGSKGVESESVMGRENGAVVVTVYY